MFSLHRRPLWLLLVTLFVSAAQAQDRKPTTTLPTAATTTPTAGTSAAAKAAPKPYREVITAKAKTNRGLITSHLLDDKWYFEIPDSLLGRELMTVTRYAKTAAGGGIFGGEEVNRQVVRWEKGPENKLFLRSVTYTAVSTDSSDKPMFQSVKNSSAEPIVGVFDVKAYRKDSSAAATVIEVTEFFKGDNQVFSLDNLVKQRFKLTTIQADRSYIQSIRSYPINTEIRTVKTFGVVPATITPPSPVPVPQIGQYLPAGRDAGVVTMEFNTSMILLPKVPMRKRLFDSRVGYFASQYTVFGEESQNAEEEVFAVRWRLEPKNAADAARQQAGELIEPKKPIVYYIDPATPQKWQSFLKQGVDDWQIAFEKAGWKNAIRGEYWPKNDTTMSLEDARFSVIRYFAADIENAYGPNVNDPRSGEIIESHIGWYHNVMRLLRNWYVIQAAASDKRAQHKKFDDALMGQLIRFVSSHEVGHTLGLRHNMGASSATPVEKLRDKAWVAANGHTSSIMDYARFNYVAQPEDGVTDFFPRIGDYDKWAIEWGYKIMPGTKTQEDDKKALNALTKERVKNPRLWFGTEISPFDPRSQTEDLSDNAMKASDYGIMNLKRILPNLPAWSTEDGEHYQELQELYDNVVSQFRRYMGHVTKNVGGIYDSPKTYDQPGAVFTVVPRNTQREAVSFLQRQVFTTPVWLLEPGILEKIRPDQGVEAIKSIQETTLNNLLDGGRLLRLMETSSRSTANYSLDEFMTDLRTGIFAELKTGKPMDMYRRNLQKVMADKLIGALTPGSAPQTYILPGAGYQTRTTLVDLKKTDLPSVARAQLELLLADIRQAQPRQTDKMSLYHLKDVQKRIEFALDPRK